MGIERRNAGSDGQTRALALGSTHEIRSGNWAAPRPPVLDGHPGGTRWVHLHIGTGICANEKVNNTMKKHDIEDQGPVDDSAGPEKETQHEPTLFLPAPAEVQQESGREGAPADAEQQSDASPEFEINEELCATAPPLLPEELELIEADMKSGRRIRSDIIVWRDRIVHGDLLFRLARKHNVPFQPVVLDMEHENDVREHIIRHMLAQKHLNKWWRVVLALALKEILSANGQRRQGWRGDDFLMSLSGAAPLNTRALIAKLASVSQGIVSDVEMIISAFETGRIPPTIRRKLETGECSISSVAKTLRHARQQGDGDGSGNGSSGEGGDGGAGQPPPPTGMSDEQKKALEEAKRFPLEETFRKFESLFKQLMEKLRKDDDKSKRHLAAQMFLLGKQLARSGRQIEEFYHASVESFERERRAGR